MADDPVGRDAAAGDDIAAQRLDRAHLLLGEFTVAPFMAGIDDLDPDRDVVQTVLAEPARHPGVKGAAFLGHQPPDRAVFLDEVMRADLGLRVAQPVERVGGALHAGVMQHQRVDRAHIRRLAAAAVIGRQPLAYLDICHARITSTRSPPDPYPQHSVSGVRAELDPPRGTCRAEEPARLDADLLSANPRLQPRRSRCR